jgi:hypothetical protein
MEEQYIDVQKHLKSLQEKMNDLKSELLRTEGAFRVFAEFLQKGLEKIVIPGVPEDIAVKTSSKLEEIN